jgi:hypothetical protein
MTEGWLNDEYLVLFSQEESISLSSKYKFPSFLPGYTLVGLRGWDDFIVIDPAGAMSSLPTVPLDAAARTEFSLPDSCSLEPDGRFIGKIKWYVKPLVFGGNPEDKDNLAWVTPEQHVELVVWWNDKYKTQKSGGAGA